MARDDAIDERARAGGCLGGDGAPRWSEDAATRRRQDLLLGIGRPPIAPAHRRVAAGARGRRRRRPVVLRAGSHRLRYRGHGSRCPAAGSCGVVLGGRVRPPDHLVLLLAPAIPVRTREEAPLPLRGARGRGRIGVRDPGRGRQRHRPVEEPLGPDQLHVASDLRGDACGDRHHRDRDGLTVPDSTDPAHRQVADRDRSVVRDRPRGGPPHRGRRRVPDRARLGRPGPSPLRVTGWAAHPRRGDGSAPGARRRGDRDPRCPAAAPWRGRDPCLDAGGSPARRQDLRPRRPGRPARGRHLVRDLASRRQTGLRRAARAGGARGLPHLGRRARRHARDDGHRGGRDRPGRCAPRARCRRTAPRLARCPRHHPRPPAATAGRPWAVSTSSASRTDGWTRRAWSCGPTALRPSRTSGRLTSPHPRARSARIRHSSS